MLDLSKITPNVVSLDMCQYCLGIAGDTGVGKTTAMHKILSEASEGEKKPLFLMFEDRYQSIDGIMAIKINSVADLDNIVKQLKNNPKLHSLYSCIVIDTVDKYEELLERFITTTKEVEILADIGKWSEGSQRLKSKLRYVNDIRNAGYPIHFIFQSSKTTDAKTGVTEYKLSAGTTTVRYITQMIVNLGYLFQDSDGKRYLTFKNSAFNGSEYKTAFSNKLSSDRISFLKSDCSLPAKLLPEEYVTKSIEAKSKYQHTTQERTLSPNTMTVPFESLKEKCLNLGNLLYKSNLTNETMAVINEVLGKDENGKIININSLTEHQYDAMNIIYNKLEELATKNNVAVE